MIDVDTLAVRFAAVSVRDAIDAAYGGILCCAYALTRDFAAYSLDANETIVAI